MIDNPMRVKDLIKNLANGDSGRAQLLQRRYVMERFLERVSASEYKENLVLKGGMLVTSLLDIGERMTRDTDVTMLDKSLTIESALEIVKEISSIDIGDATIFEVKNAYEIMEDSEYGGVRIEMEARFGRSRIPVKLDISAGDALTPSAVSYTYCLMLEDRAIEILAYNIETVLAEKIETMLFRSTLNTRMRDFFDVWALSNLDYAIDGALLGEALRATTERRGHEFDFEKASSTLEAIEQSEAMAIQWENFQSKNEFASCVTWDEAFRASRTLCIEAIS